MTTILMAEKPSILQFLVALMDEYGFARVEFVQALGYRNLERAFIG